MKHQYESELIEEIVESRGHEKSSLHYQSECLETWIYEAKGAYPKLCDCRSEWLYYISILDDMGGSEKPEPPIGEFPYETITTNSIATVNNVVPLAYKSAILKGNTDESLQSVKMPVLTTTGKNLFDGKLEYGLLNNKTGLPMNSNDYVRSQNFIPINGERFSFTVINGECGLSFCYYDKDKNFISSKVKATVSDNTSLPAGAAYLKFRTYPISSEESITNNLNTQIQIEVGSVATTYEPYKSNILTVNEEVTLRSNGDVYDELNLLTGRLTQRIDENNEVLSQEVVKTVDLMITNQDGETLSNIKPIEGTMNIVVTGEPIAPTAILEIPVEAITQNLASFIEEE